jgi:hypothetical protein
VAITAGKINLRMRLGLQHDSLHKEVHAEGEMGYGRAPLTRCKGIIIAKRSYINQKLTTHVSLKVGQDHIAVVRRRYQDGLMSKRKILRGLPLHDPLLYLKLSASCYWYPTGCI